MGLRRSISAKSYFIYLAILLNIFNVADAFFTIEWVSNNVAQEANPLMDLLLSHSPVLFATVKIVLVALGSVLLCRYKESRAAWFALACCLVVYASIMAIHYRIAADNFSFLLRM